MAALRSGTRLGPYEILSSVGEGGMGDVYKARDTRLDRIVAVKVSKEEFTPRFETEARATAALEHQHICRLYDVCHEGGASFLVMEYVEGTPLKGPLPLDQALTYARQIAGALDEAHRKQIVHRDLKPSNILVTKGGVKLLDFGLAKLGRNDTPLDDAALTRGITAAGTILGTLHYMSPEQLQGRVADARSDIFAFGLVLYEMLTGKRAFDGASAASIIAAILERPAPSITAVAPASLDRLLQRCLAKDPEERWQSARDIKAALDLIVEPAMTVPPTPMALPRQTVLWPWLAAGALGIGLVAVSLIHFRETQPQASLVRFQIPVPEGARITAPALSPDGRYVAFVAASRTGASQIWVRQLDSLESRLLPGTENAGGNLFWSPDSRDIAFVEGTRLKTIDASGREVRTLADVQGPIGGGAWSADGIIIVSRFRGGLLRVPASGGSPSPLTTLESDDTLHLAPSVLPDGRHYSYVAVTRNGAVGRVAALDGSESREFPIERGSAILYVRTHTGHGYFLFARGATLLARPVDTTTFAPAGEPLVIADDLSVAIAPGTSPTIYSVSATNALAYLAGETFHPTQVTWFDRGGKAQGVVGTEAVYNDIALSPDDTRVALTKRDGVNDDIWLVDLSRNVPTRFTFDAAQDWHPVWSPDGTRLVFASTRLLGGTINSMFWKEASSVGNEQLVMRSNANERVDDWSPDGKLLLVNRTEGRDDLWIVPFDPGGAIEANKATPYLNSPAFTETRGQFYPVKEPDGRSWVAYTSNETGEYEVYVESYPRGAQKERISTKGGTQPRWRRDGKELFYISPDLRMMAVDVTKGAKLAFGAPKELFQTRISLGGTLAYRMLRYDVTRDGQRFLINSEPDSARPSPSSITVVLNWTSLLKR